MAKRKKQRLLSFFSSDLYLSPSGSVYQPSDFWIRMKSQTFTGVNTSGVILHSGHNFRHCRELRTGRVGGKLLSLKFVNKLLAKIHGITEALLNETNCITQLESKLLFYQAAKHDPVLGEAVSYMTPGLLKAHEFNANSVFGALENIAYVQQYLPAGKASFDIFELGAGAGLTTLGILESYQESKAVICDLPETIGVGYTLLNYFSEGKLGIILPNEWDGQWPLSGNKRLLFVTPSQIANLPEDNIDLFINANSMTEMDIEVVEGYFREFVRIGTGRSIFVCKNLEYSKQRETRSDFESYPWHLMGEWLYKGIAPYSSMQHSQKGRSMVGVVRVRG